MQTIALTLGVLLAAVDPKAAQGVYEQAHALCTADAGSLWNHSLCGPMMFVDPTTGDALATHDGSSFEPVTLPKDAPIGNTVITFEGTRYTEILWPAPAD